MIYVVDDHSSVRRGIVRSLQAAGFSVRAFASGEELFAYGLTAQCDCIVADVHLPGIDGLELLQQVVDKKVDVPVILITSQDEVSLRSAARKGGALAFLHKPVDERALIDSIEFAVEKRRQ